MPFVVADDVRRLQEDIRRDLTVLTRGVLSAGHAPLSDADAHSFAASEARAQAFLAEEPSNLSAASQMDQGQAIQNDVSSWHERLRKYGIDTGLAPTVPAPGLLPSLSAALASIPPEAILLIAVLFLAKDFFRGRR